MRPLLLLGVVLAVLALLPTAPLAAEGSSTMYPANTASAYRANIEWRTTTYGEVGTSFNVLRRTLLKVFVNEGEYLLLGSSGVAVSGTPNLGDIRVFNPGQVTGLIGRETIPALAGAPAAPQSGAFANGFSCLAQRQAAGGGDRGRIGSRQAELAGPNTPNNLRPGGYTPCVYRAPAAGIYDVVFTGPSGATSNTEPQLSGRIDPTEADFGPLQRTSVTAWDVTVRTDLNSPIDESGRLFLYYMAGNTGGGGRQVESVGYVVTTYGFVYRVTYGGDPFGFIVYANQLGFQDSDGTPLYHNVVANPNAPTQAQNELRDLQGGVQLLPPEYPIFFELPYGPALDALRIPRTPEIPSIGDFRFSGEEGGTTTEVGRGGTFTFTTSQPGVYNLVLSQDGQDFAPRAPRNRLLRRVALQAGTVSVPWDGLDNSGEVFPEGSYVARTFIQGGEAHFPFLDVENNLPGGPVVELINPPDTNGDGVGNCPPWNGGCFGAFYDDTGYITANGTTVGVAQDGPLCGPGVGNPPDIGASDPVFGYDTRTRQRSFGFAYDANPSSVCLPTGGFGDKKGLDLWTFYPSNLLQTPLQIVARLAITLLDFNAGLENGEVAVRWTTGSERETAGYYLLRSDTGQRADASRVSGLIPARGSAASGAEYRWVDPGTDPAGGATYWLQEVEIGGRINEYGPARLGSSTAAVGDFALYMPLLRR